MKSVTKLTLPTLTLALVALAAPALAQDLQIECEVYRFAEGSQVLAPGKPLQVAEVRKKGRLRYHARVPFRLRTQARVASTRRIPFRTQTVNQGVTQTSVQFMEIRDALTAEARAEKGKAPQSVALHIELSDVVPGHERAELPVVVRQDARVVVGLDFEREVVLIQRGLAGPERVQIVIVRFVRPKPAASPGKDR